MVRVCKERFSASAECAVRFPCAYPACILGQDWFRKPIFSGACRKRMVWLSDDFLAVSFWIASSLALLAMTAKHTSDHKTHLRIPAAQLPGFCLFSSPSKEGAGNAGCALHPRSRVQICAKSAHTSIQVQRKHSGIPHAMALRLMARSSRRRIRLVTVIGGLTVLSNPVGLAKPPPI